VNCSTGTPSSPASAAVAVARLIDTPVTAYDRPERVTGSAPHAPDWLLQRALGGAPFVPDIKTELLFKLTANVPSITDLGETPYGRRRIAQVAGGTFEGPRLKGKVLPGGGDWLLLRRDGVLQLDVRLTLETDDKQMIYMTYKGFRHGPKDVIDRLNRGEAVDAGLYYFRTTPYFETSSDKYAWMNSICCVASGSRSAAGPTYHVFQVL
jgi:Protein of unknown function (DUF3237)